MAVFRGADMAPDDSHVVSGWDMREEYEFEEASHLPREPTADASKVDELMDALRQINDHKIWKFLEHKSCLSNNLQTKVALRVLKATFPSVLCIILPMIINQ